MICSTITNRQGVGILCTWVTHWTLPTAHCSTFGCPNALFHDTNEVQDNVCHYLFNLAKWYKIYLLENSVISQAYHRKLESLKLVTTKKVTFNLCGYVFGHHAVVDVKTLSMLNNYLLYNRQCKEERVHLCGYIRYRIFFNQKHVIKWRNVIAAREVLTLKCLKYVIWVLSLEIKFHIFCLAVYLCLVKFLKT